MAAEIERLDLRSITRSSDRAFTRVILIDDYAFEHVDRRIDWILLGESNLRTDVREPWLESHLNKGVTDFEHDSAYALRLPLIGLTLGGLAVMNNVVHFKAWINPNRPDDFHVPEPKYDPTKHPDACECPDCKGDDRHIIVPEGFYVPPANPELFEKVRGRQVEIQIGTVFIP